MISSREKGRNEVKEVLAIHETVTVRNAGLLLITIDLFKNASGEICKF